MTSVEAETGVSSNFSGFLTTSCVRKIPPSYLDIHARRRPNQRMGGTRRISGLLRRTPLELSFEAANGSQARDQDGPESKIPKHVTAQLDTPRISCKSI